MPNVIQFSLLKEIKEQSIEKEKEDLKIENFQKYVNDFFELLFKYNLNCQEELINIYLNNLAKMNEITPIPLKE